MNRVVLCFTLVWFAACTPHKSFRDRLVSSGGEAIESIDIPDDSTVSAIALVPSGNTLQIPRVVPHGETWLPRTLSSRDLTLEWSQDRKRVFVRGSAQWSNPSANSSGDVSFVLAGNWNAERGIAKLVSVNSETKATEEGTTVRGKVYCIEANEEGICSTSVVELFVRVDGVIFSGQVEKTIPGVVTPSGVDTDSDSGDVLYNDEVEGFDQDLEAVGSNEMELDELYQQKDIQTETDEISDEVKSPLPNGAPPISPDSNEPNLPAPLPEDEELEKSLELPEQIKKEIPSVSKPAANDDKAKVEAPKKEQQGATKETLNPGSLTSGSSPSGAPTSEDNIKKTISEVPQLAKSPTPPNLAPAKDPVVLPILPPPSTLPARPTLPISTPPPSSSDKNAERPSAKPEVKKEETSAIPKVVKEPAIKEPVIKEPLKPVVSSGPTAPTSPATPTTPPKNSTAPAKPVLLPKIIEAKKEEEKPAASAVPKLMPPQKAEPPPQALPPVPRQPAPTAPKQPAPQPAPPPQQSPQQTPSPAVEPIRQTPPSPSEKSEQPPAKPPVPSTEESLGEKYHDQSIGNHAKGSLRKPTSLKAVVERLAERSRIRVIHPEQRRYFGNYASVEFLFKSSVLLNRLSPNMLLEVGDLSSEKGGRLSPHKSHQNGLDMDVGFFFEGVKKGYYGRTVLTSKGLDSHFDRSLHWKFFKSMMTYYHDKIYFILLHPSVKKAMCDEAVKSGDIVRGKEVDPIVMHTLRRLVPERSHHNHFHVRIKCPAKDSRCIQTTRDIPMTMGCFKKK